ncbi:hypothetical protein DH2020_007082 [Rehmannia glutinosa]|uniref:F-box domain-containing protein n=1 Tax=Rehmannia glutinosa TaxID=99300 RepID=A0ABR0TWX5_REHGL
MEEDRISKLPDAIIQHILSSLDPKQVVQTSVLSKRWTKLWSTLPDLRFDYGHLLIQSGMDIPWTYNNTEFMSHFTRFVIHFLSRRDDSSTVGKFRLTSADLATDSAFVETCLYYAINHGVQHLDLDVYSSPTPFRFPDGLFVSKTLRELRMKQYTRSVVVPKPFVLPNLKTLYLDSFKFIEDNNGDLYSFPKEPFSKFDNLEKLTLHRCEVSGMIICSAKLRILEISFRGPLFSRETKMEQILAPELISFRYEGYVSLVCPKMDFPCLEEVYFDNFANLQTPYTVYQEKDAPEFGKDAATTWKCKVCYFKLSHQRGSCNGSSSSGAKSISISLHDVFEIDKKTSDNSSNINGDCATDSDELLDQGAFCLW